jgi:galactokinase/mevalonate kinase-like predicted kinase
MKLPEMNPETLARLVFCFENNPEREDGFVSGAQDAIGICVPGLCRHFYNGHFWPERIETCTDEPTLAWLESHLCMIPLQPRRQGCSVVEGKDITPGKVRALTSAADACWDAIMSHDLDAFGAAYRASFDAQVAMFPGMVCPAIMKADGTKATDTSTVTEAIARWSALPDVRAWKMPGAGGGGYLALVVDDAEAFCLAHAEAIALRIRRK